jgi:chorismate synthase
MQLKNHIPTFSLIITILEVKLMSSMWNNRISISIFGESHGAAIGVVMDNLPPGEYIDLEQIAAFLKRRAPKKDKTSTPRNEKDLPQIMSGLVNNKTTGTPLCAFIQNTDTRSNDYANVSKLARPGHADYTGALRYKGFNDVRGGGHFSGRLTAPLCFAGAVCGQILERRGIYTGAHIASIHNIKDTAFNRVTVSKEDILKVREKYFPVISDKKGELMVKDIEKARECLDSVGGTIECASVNVPAGIGSPIFDGLENSIAQLVFGIPAVKALEFGAGFDCAKMTGSQNNDEFYVDAHGHVMTKTNNHGGILGGISSGMPITLKVAIKPTPSISQPQATINYSSMENDTIVIKGRHDPCIIPRAVPCVESAVNIALLSHMIDYPNF